MRVVLAGALALSALLVFADRADAAMAVRMKVAPATPVAGQAATLSVQTLAPFTKSCVDEPGADYRPWSDWGGPLVLVARATVNGGPAISVPLARRESDLTYYDGAIVFPASGTWTLRMSSPDWSQAGPSAEACAGARITIAVVDRLPSTATGRTEPAGSSALVPLVAVLLAFVWLSRRARVRVQSDRHHHGPTTGVRWR